MVNKTQNKQIVKIFQHIYHNDSIKLLFFLSDNPSYFALPDKVLHDAAAAENVSETDSCSRSAPGRVWAEAARSLGSPKRREPESPRRREFRALLRSMSAREPEQTENFLRGHPRPGDCAPGDMRHTSTGPRIKYVHSIFYICYAGTVMANIVDYRVR